MPTQRNDFTKIYQAHLPSPIDTSKERPVAGVERTVWPYCLVLTRHLPLGDGAFRPRRTHDRPFWYEVRLVERRPSPHLSGKNSAQGLGRLTPYLAVALHAVQAMLIVGGVARSCKSFQRLGGFGQRPGLFGALE